MRVSKLFPWRRLRGLLIPVMAVVVLYVLISAYFYKSPLPDDGIIRTEHRRNAQSDETMFYHMANLGLPWLHAAGKKVIQNAGPAEIPKSACVCSGSYRPSADIYTYNLPDVANYSLDSDREYMIPDPRKDIVKRKSSDSFDREPIQVILVPFSHADPGYGNTMEGYYASATKSKETY